LVTKVDRTGIRQYDVSSRRDLIRALPVAFLDNQQEVYQRILTARERGQCVCWIRNTIRDISETYHELKQFVSGDAIHVFHSRFAMTDRLKIEERVCKMFGKDSGPSDREGKVLIASQVVEQSLDLDFDVLITDLAPIDLMIQRAGRQHRHQRDRQGNPVTNAGETSGREPPVLYVHAPPETEAPSQTWYKDYLPAASYVYPNAAQLWRTKEILRQEGRIELPGRARALVEAVYGEEPLATPEVFLEAEDRAWGEDAAARDQADFNTIVFEKGYCQSGGNWDSEERIRTRLGEEQRTVYLAHFENGQLSPYCTDEYGWDLSAIKVRAASFQGEIDYPDDLRKAIEVMRNESWIDNDALFLVVQGWYRR
jgi:CRISPR-associated endonuclease/helicase Cas3